MLNDQTKDDLQRRLKWAQMWQNYNDNKAKSAHPIQNAINGIGNLYKNVSGYNAGMNALNSINQPAQPSAEFMGKIGASMPQGMSFNTPASSIEGLGSTSLNTQAMPTNTLANGASQGTGLMSKAGGALGKVGGAAGAIGGALSAGSNFAKGDNVNGALDVAKTGAMFIPGVGWIVSGAIQIGQMVRNAINQKAQERMKESQEAVAKGEQEAGNAAQRSMQVNKQAGGDMEQLVNDAQQQAMQQSEAMAQPQDNSQVIAELMNRTNAMQEQPMFQQSPMQQDQGQFTGAAADVQAPQGYAGQLPILSQEPNYAEESMPTMTPEENAIIAQQYQQPQQQMQLPQEDVKQTLMDKFRRGLSDFSAGYQDNANSDFAHGDLMNNISTGGAAPVQQGGQFNLGAEANKKSIMAKLGEMAGTGQRIMAHPLTQAAIAGGISRMAGGDIDDVAKAAFQYGSQKAAADRYYQQVTGNTNRPFLNSYSATDVTNKRLEDAMAQRQQQWMYEQMMKKAQQDWENQYKTDKDERDYNYKVNKDKEDMAFKNKEYNAKINNLGGYGRREYPRSAVQEEKYAYQQGLNKSLGQFQKYADALNKAKEKEGFFTNSKDKAAIEKAQNDYNKAREFMVNTYGGDFIKYAKEQGWE